MGRKTERNIPGQLEGIAQRFESWRSGRKRRGRIPEALWEAAVAAGREHGVHRTARKLHLNYADLAKRVQAAGATAEPKTRFIEFAASAMPCGNGCVIEVEATKGAKLRVELKTAAAMSDIAALARSLWSGEK